jgi:hypothetical protein
LQQREAELEQKHLESLNQIVKAQGNKQKECDEMMAQIEHFEQLLQQQKQEYDAQIEAIRQEY